MYNVQSLKIFLKKGSLRRATIARIKQLEHALIILRFAVGVNFKLHSKTLPRQCLF